MLNKDKIIKAEIIDSKGKIIISTISLEFPKDFFTVKGTEFVVFKGKNILPINKDELVDAVFYYMNGSRVKYSTKIDLATDMQVNIHIGTDYVVLEERRRYFKTDANIVGKILLYTSDDEEVVLEDPINVRIKNINIGGVFMITHFDFKIGDTFMLSLLDDTITVFTEILRIQKDNNDEVIGYGCKFLNVTPMQEEIIARYIFKSQIFLRNKRKHLN